MNERKLRLIDELGGKILCLLLTLHRRLFGRRRVQQGPPRSILFVKLVEQGASVLAADAFARACTLVGREHVYIVVFAENREILSLLGLLPEANILAVRTTSVLRLALDLLAAVRTCRQRGIDATVDLEFLSRGAAIFAYLTGARLRSGIDGLTMDGPYRGDLLTHRVSYNPYVHVAKTYRLLVDALEQPAAAGMVNKVRPPASTYAPVFQATPDELRAVEARLAERLGRPLASGPRLVLNPNAGDLMPLRKWPTARFVGLAQRLLATYPDATIILTGAPRERAQAEAVRQAIGSDRVVSMAGFTTLRELLVLFTISDVLVTNDSGPAHFASMTDIANIVLFGPETPLLYAPVAGHPLVLTAGLSCSPCINALNQRLSPCSDNVCMQELGLDQVFAAVASRLPAVDKVAGRKGATGRAVPPAAVAAWQLPSGRPSGELVMQDSD